MFSIIGLKTVKFDDYVWLEGDTWEYQSMAINWSKDRKLMTEDAFGDYKKDYKFHPAAELYQPQVDYLREKGEVGGTTSFQVYTSN